MNKRRVSVLVVLALALGVVVAHATFKDAFEPQQLLRELKAFGSSSAALWAFSALYVISTSALLPSAVLHVVGGAMWGFFGGVVPNLVLSNVVGHLHFGLGRWLGRDRMRALLERRGWTAAIDELEHSGVLTVLVLRQTPIPFMVTNLVCGASPITWRQFVVGHFIGLLPGVLIATWFSAALAEGVEGAKEAALVRLAIVGGGVVAIALITRVGMALARRRRASVA